MTDYAMLISDYFAGTISQADAATLRAYILESPQNARHFLQAAALHTNLRDHFSATQTHIPETFSLIRRRSWLARISATAGIAAVLAILITLAIWYHWITTPIARLTQTVDARWLSVPPAEGAMISRQTQKLASGFATFEFAQGAKVLVQGPAEFRLESASSIRLYSGRITTSVPEPAIGFTVNIPSASVVDLGTEVGIDVSDDQSHIEVFKGKAGIRLAKTPAAAPLDRIMQISNSVDIDSGGDSIQDSPPEPLAFTRVDDLTPVTDTGSAAATYTQHLLTDPSLLAYYAFDAHDEVFDQLTNHAVATLGKYDGTPYTTTWTRGPSPDSHALAFNGGSSRVLLNIPEPATSLTIVTRVKVATIDRDYTSLLMSDGNDRPTACHFQISNVPHHPVILFSNPAPAKPVPYNNYHFQCPENLTLNNWHLLIVVYNTNTRRVSCWIDDQLLADLPMVDPTPLTIGSAQIGSWTGGDAHSSRSLTGAITQVGIWKRPLSPDEIHALYFAQLPATNP